MEILIISVAVFLNFMLLVWKLNKERYADFAVDLATLIALSYLFSGTVSGMIIALIAGAMMSIYLAIFPPQFMKELV